MPGDTMQNALQVIANILAFLLPWTFFSTGLSEASVTPN
jgi:hypothetical protein